MRGVQRAAVSTGRGRAPIVRRGMVRYARRGHTPFTPWGALQRVRQPERPRAAPPASASAAAAPRRRARRGRRRRRLRGRRLGAGPVQAADRILRVRSAGRRDDSLAGGLRRPHHHGDHGRARGPAAGHRLPGRRRQGQLVPRRRDAAGVRPGAAAQASLPHLEDVHRRRHDARPIGKSKQRALVGQRLDRPARHRPRQGQAVPARGARSTASCTRSTSTTGKIVWEYDYDDIIKSSPTVIEDPSPKSRRTSTSSWPAPAAAGRRTSPTPAWRRTGPSRSAPARSSGACRCRSPPATAATWTAAASSTRAACTRGSRAAGSTSSTRSRRVVERLPEAEDHRQPAAARHLHGPAAHAGNLVLEASPCLLDNVVYISSGAGHVYGMRRSDLKVVWDYRTGSDMDGTAVPTDVRQAARGRREAVHQRARRDPHARPVQGPRRLGRVVLPHRRPQARRLGGRRDRVDGRQRRLRPVGPPPRLAAFSAIDGNLYVVSQNQDLGQRPRAPAATGRTPRPRVVAKFYLGGSISTPIMVDDTIVAAGYDNRIHLYKIKYAPAEKGDAGALKSPPAAGSPCPSPRRTPSPPAAPSRAPR